MGLYDNLHWHECANFFGCQATAIGVLKNVRCYPSDQSFALLCFCLNLMFLQYISLCVSSGRLHSVTGEGMLMLKYIYCLWRKQRRLNKPGLRGGCIIGLLSLPSVMLVLVIQSLVQDVLIPSSAILHISCTQTFRCCFPNSRPVYRDQMLLFLLTICTSKNVAYNYFFVTHLKSLLMWAVWAIFRSNQWSTTGLSKAVVCTVLSMEKCI